MVYVFVISCLIIAYSYLLYGLLIFVVNKLKKGQASHPAIEGHLPPVTLIIAAYNEEEIIKQKIENSLSLDYPIGRLTILVVTDGSSDRTPDIVRQFTQTTLLHQPERAGKAAAVDRAMSMVTTPITVFTDANTMLDKQALKHLVKHYANPAVGGVAGEKKVIAISSETAGMGEGLYWKYESWLKKQDWLLYSVVGAAGELFSVRSALYRSPGQDAILDDFIISLKVCELGYRFAYEPLAFAMETPSANIKEERKRKVRISAGAFQAMWRMKSLLNIFRFPMLSFQYISHRVLRWTLCPLAFLLALVSNVVLVVQQAGSIFTILLALQGLLYFLAAIGWMVEQSGRAPFWGKIPKLAYYFIFIQVSVFMGFFRFLKGRQTVLWDRAARSSASVMQA